MAYKQISPIPVVEGGTGAQSFIVDTPICAGVTSSSALQSVAFPGNSGDVLISNGSSALPAFAEFPTGGGWDLLTSYSISSPEQIVYFTGGINSMYDNYAMVISNAACSAAELGLVIQFSNGGGWTSGSPTPTMAASINTYGSNSWTDLISTGLGGNITYLTRNSAGISPYIAGGVFYFYGLSAVRQNICISGQYVMRNNSLDTQQGISSLIINNYSSTPFYEMRVRAGISANFTSGRFLLYGLKKS